MNAIELEIRNMSAYVVGSVKRIKNIFADGYLVRSPNEYQIAIPFDREGDFSDDFVGIHMNSGDLEYAGEKIHVLYLHASDTLDIIKLVPIAEQFIWVSSRSQILDDPYGWFDEWRKIFGDSVKKQSVSDVVAEMVAFREIRKIDPTVKWMGPKGGSQDIVGKDHLYEVKSTTTKSGTKVFINSAIQLMGNKPESLVFVRLEYKPYGETIESIKEDLLASGYPEEEVEANLARKGILKGSKYRKIGYEIIEILSYDVTPDIFPKITLSDLNEKAPLNNIIDYQLTLSLDTLPSTSIFKKD